MHPPRRAGGAFAAALSCILAFVCSAAIHAATIHVTTTADAGAGSLRAALATAASGDTIAFDPALFAGGSPRTIALASTLTLERTVTIVGPGDGADGVTPGLVLSGQNLVRILHVKCAGGATISGVTFSGGRSSSGGAAVFVASGASATFLACDFTGNTATSTGTGGAILNQGTSRLDRCRLETNSAAGGGAIATQGKLVVTRSLLAGNAATGAGGAILVTDGTTTLESSTISTNTAARAGGLAVVATKGGAQLAIVACTVASNAADTGAGGLYAEGSCATATTTGSIFAYNSIKGSGGARIPRDLATQKSGRISSGNHNLVTKSGETLSPCLAQDQLNVDPLLGPLAFNGGRTRTHAIPAGSPAVDRGKPGFAGSLVTTDQRGLPRVAPGSPSVCDIGAFELYRAELTVQPPVTIECQGAATPALITAALNLPAGGTVSATWTINGLAAAPVSLAVPAGSTAYPISHAGLFQGGANSVALTVTGSGFSLTKDTTVTVVDTTPPTISLVGDALVALPLGTPFADPGAIASDLCGGPLAVIRTLAGSEATDLDPCLPGAITLVYTATDAAGNSASVTRQVTVVADVSLSAPASVAATLDPASRAAAVDLASAVTVTGLPNTCAATVFLTTTITPPGGAASSVAGLPVVPFPSGTSQVRVEAILAVPGCDPEVLAAVEFAVTVADPYGVTLNNVAWPLAIEVDLDETTADGRARFGTFTQMIARVGESRWYKFRAPPGARVDVSLLNLPANFDLVLYSDVEKAYAELLGLLGSDDPSDQKLALLGAEFAAEAYSGKGFSAEAYSAEAYSGRPPGAEAYSAEAYSGRGPGAEAYSAEAYSAEAYSAEAYSAEAYSAEAYSAEAYSGAQLRSRIAFSAAPGTLSEGIRFNTYTSEGTFYVRVRGRNGTFSTVAPFDLIVSVQQDLCAGVTDTAITAGPSPVSGAPAHLLLWDSTRIAGTPAEVAELAVSLDAFAAAVDGAVVDLGLLPRIVALNTQADANPYCPYAKNLVAEAIRQVILAARGSAPSIRTITLVGPDAVIPFFRTDDQALLASESNYFPPVLDPTHSQSALRLAQVLTQDRYGATAQLALGTGPYSLPDLPVGRIVETAAEAADYLEVHRALFDGRVATNGVLPVPRSALAVGYDFLADAAGAMRDEFAAALGAGATVDTLISSSDTPPELGWTAAQLRAAFLGSRRDVSYLAGHFSTSGALAADYTTRFSAAELDASATDLTFALVVTPGCHSGYNTVDSHAVPFVTEQPDWAQAFSRKFVTLVAGTGYQYGDTEIIEYTERLHVLLARVLREGTGPVPLGRALVDAKNRYLAETPIMRGIHEKSLVQVTLYGLPMVQLDLPGTRLTPVEPAGDIPATAPVVSGPGATRGLRVGELTIDPVLTRVDKTLDVLGTTDTVVASYYRGGDGVLTLPGEPVRPLESVNLSRPVDGFVRGVGFRGGSYAEEGGFIPLTGAAVSDARGVFGRFVCDVFYPARPWNLNQVGEIVRTEGISALSVFPAQFLSDDEDAITGRLRRFSRMSFSVFYCPEISVGALANPPAINAVTSSVADGVARFEIEVAASGAGGVQEAWITYTGLPGSSLFGAWHTLTLVPPAAAHGSGVWTGELPLPAGTSSSQIRFMVQAVNGIGAVALNSDFGRTFALETSTLAGSAGAGSGTQIAFVDPVPASGVYRDTRTASARLTDAAGDPVADARVVFQLGPIFRAATTDAAGIATAELLLNMQPGASELEASFAGDESRNGSSVASPFVVGRRPSQLVFESAAVVSDASDVVVLLTSDDGVPLKERTVLFLLDDGAGVSAVAEITDGAGRARLTRPVAAGASYLVSAYFGQSVVVPGGATVTMEDPLYLPSSATTTVDVLAPLTFDRLQAWLAYADGSAPGATWSNRGLTSAIVAGRVRGSSPDFTSASIMATPDAGSVTARLRATLAGRTIADGDVVLRTGFTCFGIWAGEACVDGVRISLVIDWNRSGTSGAFKAWILPPPGAGPLYRDQPAVLDVEITLGTGPGEHSAGGAFEIGGDANGWTHVSTNSRLRLDF